MSNGLILGSVVRTTLLNDLSGEASGPSWEGLSPTFPRQKIKRHPIQSLKQYRRYFNRAIFLAHVPIPLQDGKVGRKKEFTGGRVYFIWWWHGRRERSLIHDSYTQVLVPSSKSSGSPPGRPLCWSLWMIKVHCELSWVGQGPPDCIPLRCSQDHISPEVWLCLPFDLYPVSPHCGNSPIGSTVEFTHGTHSTLAQRDWV